MVRGETRCQRHGRRRDDAPFSLLASLVVRLYSELNRIKFARPADALLLSKLADTDDDYTWGHIEGNRVRIDKRKILYTTSCTFDATKKTGKLSINLYVRDDLLNNMSHGFTFNEQHVVTEIMGMWFNLLPFRLSEIYPKKLGIISDKYAKKPTARHAERATRGFKEVRVCPRN